jgi:hypothetical protein
MAKAANVHAGMRVEHLLNFYDAGKRAATDAKAQQGQPRCERAKYLGFLGFGDVNPSGDAEDDSAGGATVTPSEDCRIAERGCFMLLICLTCSPT